MNWLKSTLIKALLRHALSAAGVWLAQNGILSGNDQHTALGALAVLCAIIHSLWEKRAIIATELDGLSHTVVPNALKLALIVTLPALLLVGCAGTQTINNESTSGFKLKLPVGWGGNNLAELDMSIGTIKTTTAIQPISTNRLYAPSIGVIADTCGSENLTALNNTNPAVVAGQRDKYVLVTGDTVGEDFSATNSNRLRLDGYQGYDPLSHTNQP